MQGKLSYRAGIKLWLNDDLAAARDAFQEGITSADQRYRSLCQGFVSFLTASDGQDFSVALQQFADADLAGGSDFSMLFVVGYSAWQLTESDLVCDQAVKAVLLLLAQRALHAVQVEMPRPMLQSLERQYDLVVPHLADLLEYRLQQLRDRLALVDALLGRLSIPDCDLSALVQELGLTQANAELCLMDRLLIAGAYLSRRVVAGQPADLARVIAAT